MSLSIDTTTPSVSAGPIQAIHDDFRAAQAAFEKAHCPDEGELHDAWQDAEGRFVDAPPTSLSNALLNLEYATECNSCLRDRDTTEGRLVHGVIDFLKAKLARS